MWAELWESYPNPVNWGVTGWAWVSAHGWLREQEGLEVSWVTPSEQCSSTPIPWSKSLFPGLGPGWAEGGTQGAKFKDVPFLGDQGHSVPDPPREGAAPDVVGDSEPVPPSILCVRCLIEASGEAGPTLYRPKAPRHFSGQSGPYPAPAAPGSWLEMQSPNLNPDLSHNMNINKMLGNPHAKKKN